MASNGRERLLTVLSRSGGNDCLNTVIPVTDPLYRDYRPNVGIPEDQIIPVTDTLGFHPSMAAMKRFWDEGKMALVLGVGYPHPSRSHFRSMDIWHTCEPDKIGEEGWLGQATREMDPKAENVLTAVNFGRGLPRALVAPGVPVASVGDLENYGVLTGIQGAQERNQALDIFSTMYAPAIGSGPVMDYIRETGRAALKGADILTTAPSKYSSSVEYGTDPIAQNMKSIAQVQCADFGTRILYTTSPYNSFDTHANQAVDHARMLQQVSESVSDYFDDLKEHNRTQEVLLFLFSEFGRRAMDNGGGTDHGTGGCCWIIGDNVKGGLYGEYPSLKREDLEDGGDLLHNVDFRSVYSTILDKWLGLNPKPIVGGSFEQIDFLN
jgi:uncharacterized protein (DUF1501 family)